MVADHARDDAVQPPLVDFGGIEGNLVRDHKAVSGGDEPELVFRGIREAVAKAKFSQNARKLVIVIGDNRDKEDNAQNETDELRIAQRLFKSGSNISPIGGWPEGSDT